MPRYHTIPHKPYTIYYIPYTEPPNAVPINRVGEREGGAGKERLHVIDKVLPKKREEM